MQKTDMENLLEDLQEMDLTAEETEQILNCQREADELNRKERLCNLQIFRVRADCPHVTSKFRGRWLA